MRMLLFSLGCLLIISCTSTQKSLQSFNKANPEGLAIGTISIIDSTSSLKAMELTYRIKNSKRRKHLKIKKYQKMANTKDVYEIAIKEPPGDYEILSFRITFSKTTQNGYRKDIYIHNYKPVKSFPLQKGSIAYIGNIIFHTANPFHPTKQELKWIDNSAKDISYFKEKYGWTTIRKAVP